VFTATPEFFGAFNDADASYSDEFVAGYAPVASLDWASVPTEAAPVEPAALYEPSFDYTLTDWYFV
jgi:hypothetical protein